MWELQRGAHDTSPKLVCWQALRSAMYLAEIGQIPADPRRWAAGAERIRDWVQRQARRIETAARRQRLRPRSPGCW
ncbi:hypothetical protein [Mycobacterium sp. 050134]|uniref:hypothetical protein n=1 Tax=Mycobacterium sp. 050134 TaxID=3096111 RepID=UPI003FA5BC07